jgi:hypothetical protein
MNTCVGANYPKRVSTCFVNPHPKSDSGRNHRQSPRCPLGQDPGPLIMLQPRMVRTGCNACSRSRHGSEGA